MQTDPPVFHTYDPGDEQGYGVPRKLNVFFKAVEGDPTCPIVCPSDRKVDHDIADEIDHMLQLWSDYYPGKPILAIHRALTAMLEEHGFEMPHST